MHFLGLKISYGINKFLNSAIFLVNTFESRLWTPDG